MLYRFNRLTLLANIVSVQFTEISAEYQPSSSYRASKSRFFPYIHNKFCRVSPTTKMTSATVKPSISTNVSTVHFTGGLWERQPRLLVLFRLVLQDLLHSQPLDWLSLTEKNIRFCDFWFKNFLIEPKFTSCYRRIHTCNGGKLLRECFERQKVAHAQLVRLSLLFE